jgi:hypothetical protein
MRQKLSKPSNQSNISRANRQGNNNGKIFPGDRKFIKTNKREGKTLPDTIDNNDDNNDDNNVDNNTREEEEIFEIKTIEITAPPKKSIAKDIKQKGKSE